MRYQNKALLFRDLRILKSAFDSKVPEAKPNDKSFLRSTLESERNEIAQTSKDYGLDCDDNDNSDVSKTSPINTQRQEQSLSSKRVPKRCMIERKAAHVAADLPLILLTRITSDITSRSKRKHRINKHLIMSG